MTCLTMFKVSLIKQIDKKKRYFDIKNNEILILIINKFVTYIVNFVVRNILFMDFLFIS